MQKTFILRGVGLALLGYLSLSLMGVCAKTLSNAVPTSTLIFMQFFVSLLGVLATSARSGLAQLKTNRPGLMMIRALSGLGGMSAMLIALHFIPLVDGMLLQNTAPLFVPLVLQIWLRKNSSRTIWLSTLVGFAGIILILKPGHGLLNSAAIIGLLGGLFTAISLVSIGLLKNTEPSKRILFYSALMNSLVMLPSVIMHGLPTQPLQFMTLVLAGIFTYLSQIAITHSFSYAQANVLAPLCYSAVIFTGLMGWAIWQHVPDLMTVIGMLLVITGGGLAIVLENKLNKSR